MICEATRLIARGITARKRKNREESPTSTEHQDYKSSFNVRESEYLKDAIALVREGDSRRNPIPLLANHKKFTRSALFLVNKNSG